MASPTMTDEELAQRFGRRGPGSTVFDACEWGYQCPKGHRGMSITWSEFKVHIWCHRCRLDYPSKDCPMQRPSWMSPSRFRQFISQLPFRPKVLRGVDRSLEEASPNVDKEMGG